MPTDTINAFGGAFYTEIDGEKFIPVRHDVVLQAGETVMNGIIDGIKEGSLEFTFSTYISANLKRIFYQQILMKSNNWLKMHGYPMRRKVNA